METTQGPGRRASVTCDRPHPETHRRTTTTTRRRDHGLSLVEVLVAVVLLGTAGVAVLGGIAATARGSGIHRDLATVQSWLSSAADEISGVATAGATCPTALDPTHYEQGEVIREARTAGVDLRVVGVEIWSGNAWVADCSDDPWAPQRIRLEIDHRGQHGELSVVRHHRSPPDPAQLRCRPGRTCPLEVDGTVRIDPTPGFER